MKIIFTTSDKALSKLIRWTFSEPVSHCGILFDSKLVFHSALFGVNVQGIYAFENVNRIICAVEVPLDLKAEEIIYQRLLEHYEGKSYDFRAFAYFAWRGFLYRFFRKPFPERNAWQRPGDFLCDGLLAALNGPQAPDWLRKALLDLGDIEMKSPYAVYQAIQNAHPDRSVQKPA